MRSTSGDATCLASWPSPCLIFGLLWREAGLCTDTTKQVKYEVTEKKNFPGCERGVISKFFFSVSKCCMLHGHSLRGNVKYSFSEVFNQ